MSAASRQPLASSYIRYAIGLLLVVNILNFVDRQIVNILGESIKHDLALADWQLGMVTGLAFALFYTVLGIPIARLAEVSNRPRLIGACIATWSIFTALCGFAHGFAQLMLARIGVGVGEAGCTPAAHSLISDYVAPAKRASAIALYSMGTPLGSVFGLTLGGFMASAFGWRAAFFVVGLPGLLLALLAMTTLREPRKGAPPAETGEAIGWRTAWAELRGNRPFWLMAMGVAATGVVGYGGGNFLPSFFFRVHGAELATLAARFGMSPISFFGLALGVVAGVAGLVGTWLGGRLADGLAARSRSAYAYVPAIAAVFAYPAYILAVLVDSTIASLLLFAVVNLLITMWPGPVFAGIHGLVQPRTRATASAVTLLLTNLIGLGLGPLALGAMSDFYAKTGGMGDAQGLRWAEVSITAAGFVSIALFWAAGRAMRRLP